MWVLYTDLASFKGAIDYSCSYYSPNMNQDDFRRLLATPARGGGGGSQGGRSYGGKRNLSEQDLDGIRKLVAKKPKHKGKKPGHDSEDKAVSAKPKAPAVIDRAAERRQREKELGTDDVGAYAHLNADQTKFLGGDLEHTHLVKGLDFALLAQLKRERAKLEQTTAELKQQQHHQQQKTPAGDKLLSSSSQPSSFQTRMGRLVYLHGCQLAGKDSHAGAPLSRSELFLPNRMYYTYNLGSAELDSVPVVVQRSKEDCPEHDEVVNGLVDDLVVARIADVLHNQRTHGKKMRRRKKSEGEVDLKDEEQDAETQNATAATATVDDDDDEDIFPDVGEYVPLDQRQEEPATNPKPLLGKDSGYFANLSASLTTAEETARAREEAAEQAWKATLQKAVDAQVRLERAEKEKAQEAKLAAQVDEYTECYPDYQAAASYDSEDDEDPARARKDLDVDLPGAEASKNNRKKQKKNAKFENDLGKIQKVSQAVY